MKYVQYVNACFKAASENIRPFVFYGQNVAAGSCLGGLSRGLGAAEGHRALNTPNVENTLVGAGFGLMLSGVSSAFFMKQQDFLLLGLDQIVNTYNAVRQRAPKASFTIVATVVDSGFEGIQSSLNNLADFCSFGRVPGYTISCKQDADAIIGNIFARPGFRILGVSQRLFGTEVLDFGAAPLLERDGELFQYARGEKLTIACCNLSLPQGKALCDELAGQGVSASLFGVAAATPVDYAPILDDAARTGRLLVLDDSKSANIAGQSLRAQALERGAKVRLICREHSEAWYKPGAEVFSVDAEDVLAGFGLK
jgi:pyruvate/2-oxoglutarate/acetoin dehydrogenase E1 component